MVALTTCMCKMYSRPSLLDKQGSCSALDLKKPKRTMALLIVTTVCLLVYAASEYRIRQALKEQGAIFPHSKGQPEYRL